MSNNFKIEVSAIDRFSKTFAKLRKDAGSAVGTVKQRLGAIDEAVENLDRDRLKKTAKGMRALADAGLSVARSFGIANPVLDSFSTGIITDLGAGAIGATAGVAGLAAGAVALGVRWGRAGFEIQRTARTIGVTTDTLQEFRGAAKLVGLSEDAMTDSFAAFARTLQNAKFGRDSTAQYTLDMLGVKLRNTKQGAIDSRAAFYDMAKAIAAIEDPQLQWEAASNLGLSEMLPLLREGPEALQRWINKSKELGLVQSGPALEAARKYNEAALELSASWSGFANVVGVQVMPVLSESLKTFTAMMSPVQFFKDFARGMYGPDFMRDKVTLTPDAAARAKRMQHMSSGVVTAPSSPASATGGTVRWNNPGNLEVPGGGAFQTFPSMDVGLRAMGAQLGRYFNRDHLNTIDGIVGKYANGKAPGNSPATEAGYVADLVQHTGFAHDQALNLNDPKTLSTLMAAMVRHEQGGRQPFAPGDYQAAAQAVTVNVNVANAPPGTRVDTKGPASQFIATRVSYTMPTGVTP
jgi:hypothetical protein